MGKIELWVWWRLTSGGGAWQDMIFSEVEKVRDTFRSTNGLIVDPVKEELERAMVNTWCPLPPRMHARCCYVIC
eukprot:3888992-Rhodomonas_salina.1